MSEIANNILELLPKNFLDNMKNLLGNNYEKYILSLKNKYVRGFRINSIKTTVENFENNIKFNTEKVPYEQFGRVLNDDIKIGNFPEHLSGMIYMQEPSSMLPVSTINFNGNEKVLDLCAAPGGKSTQIASYVKNGLIVANEIVTNRAKILFSNIERLGVKNSIIINDTPQNIANTMQGFFDVVLVDAPCSGEGMFRKDPATINEWSDERITFNAERQLEILISADRCLKKGGKLIYSTCTFSEIEDEDVILEFLKSHNYDLVDVKPECKSWTYCGTKIKEARRFFPFTGKGEGQFVCVLQKNEESEEFYLSKRLEPNYLKGKDKDLVDNFLISNFDIPYEYKLVQRHDNIMLITQEMIKVLPLKINTINAGVRVGNIEKGVLKPHHQLFSALGCFAKNKIELTHEDCKKYIHGEELDIDKALKGYACVTVYGASLGGGKCVNGKLKNLFPKGLRI